MTSGRDAPVRHSPVNGPEVADVVDELDRVAVSVIVDGRPARLAPLLPVLQQVDFGGHPWAALVVAGALQAVATGDDARIVELLVSAEDAFCRSGDERGLGCVAYVRGLGALARGNLVAAAVWWRQAREYFGDDGGPLNERALANLGLAEYHEGHLRDALLITEQALVLARCHGNRRAEGMALLYLAFFSLWAGDFGRADTLLTTARRVYNEIPDPFDRSEWPLVEAACAVLYALRRNRHCAEAAFAAALEASESLETPWFTAMIRSLRAECCASWDATRSFADARAALDFLEGIQHDDWWCRWARRALAVADMHIGNVEAARDALEALLQEPLNPIERAGTLLVLGECRWRTRNTAEALDALYEARLLADNSRSRYLQARALCLLAEVDHEHRAQWRGRALEVMDRDSAYRALLTSSTPLHIEAFGCGRILLGDRRATFATRHAEATVFILAFAGMEGVDAETLAEQFWPNVSSSVWHGRLRTLLWQIRRGLGDEAWRLERDGAIVRLDLAGATVDVDETRRRAHAVLRGSPVESGERTQLAATLRQPLVAAYQYEEWLCDHANELRGLAARLTTRPDSARP